MQNKISLCTVSVVMAAAFLGVVPGAYATVQLFPSASSLPGSSFQGADGNQTPANATTKLDWRNFKSDPDLKTLVDPSNPDREFGGGSSEDKPDTWTFSDPADSTPAKANFRVAWDLFKPDPGRLLQLAFRRAANGGNAFLAFELNQDPQLWTNSVGTKIPCRTTGDLLITYNVANSDATEIYLTVQKWTSTSSDSATGCGRTGTLSELPSSALTDGVNVQGAVNSATSNAISPELPSPPAGLPNNEKGAIPSEMETGLSCGSAANWICGGLFGETALNLPSVFEQYEKNPCFSFGSVWAHGRSSISRSSALQDYVAPATIAVRSCTASGFKFNDLNANGTWDKPAEPAVEGWKVWLDKNKDGKVDSPGEIATTNATGEYLFTDLSAGTYTIKELPASDQTSDLQNLDVCSKPSPCSSGYSVTIDKTNLTSTGNTFGNYANPRLELVKSLNPTSDPGVFDLKAQQTSGGSASISSTDSGNDQGTGKKTVTPGKWALSESAGTGTTLADYTPSLACKARGSGNPVTVTAGSIALSPGDDVICTFTNTRKTGTITVDKSLIPSDDPGLFNLLIGGKSYASDVGDGGTTGPIMQPTGNYQISEKGGTDTSLDDYNSSVACKDKEGPVKIVEDSVNLAEGQNILCTFTNTRKIGQITVTKTLSPLTDPGKFDLLIGGTVYASAVGDGGTTGAQTLNTGQYSITEEGASGTDLANYNSKLTCENDGEEVTVTDSKIDLGFGDKIVCNFTNTRKTGTVKVVKSLSPSDDPGKFNLLVNGSVKASDVGDGGTTGTLTLPTGDHSVAETAAAGNNLDNYNSSLACEDDQGPVEVSEGRFSLSEGQDIVCTFTNNRKTGTVQVIKSLSPSDDPGQFNLLIDDAVKAENVGDGGKTSQITLPTGDHRVGETAGSETSLTDYNSSLECKDGDDSVKVIDGQFRLDEGQNIVCTFTNTRKTGTIEVVKSLSPSDDPGKFDLLINNISYASNVSDGGTTGPISLPTGNYQISEKGGTDTNLDNYNSSLACQDEQGSVKIVEESVNLTEGQNIVCTFTNVRQIGTIKLVKSLSPSNDPGKFDLLLDGSVKASAVGDGGTSDTLTLATGSYTVTEAGAGSTSLGNYSSSLACQDDQGTVEVNDGKIMLSEGQNIICTFTNVRKTGTVKLVKSLTPSGDPGKFDLLIDGTVQASAVGDGGATDTLTLSTGSHTVSEVAAAGTSLADYNSSISCLGDGSPLASGSGTSLSFDLSSGQAVVCTISNDNPTEPTGTINITKQVSGIVAIGTTFSFSGTIGDPFTLETGQTKSFTLPAGSYTVSETAATGFTLDAISCSDATDTSGASTFAPPTATISLQAGETVNCTFTNSSTPVNPTATGTASATGSSGCIFPKRGAKGQSYAYMRVSGSPIARVNFYYRGKKRLSLTEPNLASGDYRFRWPVNRLRVGTNRVTAVVTFQPNTDPQRKTIKKNWVRCVYKQPRYTG